MTNAQVNALIKTQVKLHNTTHGNSKQFYVEVEDLLLPEEIDEGGCISGKDHQWVELEDGTSECYRCSRIKD